MTEAALKCKVAFIFTRQLGRDNCEVPGTATISLLQKLINIKCPISAKGGEAPVKDTIADKIFFVSVPSA